MRIISLFLFKYFVFTQTQNPTTQTTQTPSSDITTVLPVTGNYSGIPTPKPTINPNGFNPVFGDVFIVQTEYLSYGISQILAT